MRALADQFVGVANRYGARYTLVYRNIDHRTLKEVCSEIQKPIPPRKYEPFFPAEGFDDRLLRFAADVVQLQQKRHSADYDPAQRFVVSDARLAIQVATGAIASFEAAAAEHKTTFLTLLLCPPR